ncbi:MAG: hypothetical protein Q7T72_12530, partial [Bacteroidales bacterium]|nr:hypothetical protein [Bacteroidales bacterium]
MKTNKLLTTLAIVSVVLIAGCNKDEFAPTLSSGMTSVEKSVALEPLQGALAEVNLGVAGNFAILSKTGITDVYKSAITGDIGSSPITGAAI